jgi:hypothetical protein
MDGAAFILSCLSALTCILFVVLKCLGIVSFGWIWVFAPIWGTLAVVLSIAIAFHLFKCFVGAIVYLLGSIFDHF